jgi:selenocysteine-specific translation elongation factor
MSGTGESNTSGICVDQWLTGRGVTIDIATTHFETPHRNITLLDAPGHKDFIPAMISGAAQADVALMVVDGSPGEFEAGFDRGGQTREHAWLVRSLGVKEIIIGINKMDMVCSPLSAREESLMYRSIGHRTDMMRLLKLSNRSLCLLVSRLARLHICHWQLWRV